MKSCCAFFFALIDSSSFLYKKILLCTMEMGTKKKINLVPQVKSFIYNLCGLFQFLTLGIFSSQRFIGNFTMGFNSFGILGSNLQVVD